MRFDMAASPSWAADTLRAVFVKRSQPLSPRFWAVSFVISFFITLLLMGHSHIPHPFRRPREPPRPPPHRPDPNGGLDIWEPPDMEARVHYLPVSEGARRKPAYPLVPFPPSPIAAPAEDNAQHHPWLGAVICSVWDIRRRMLIRYTWMKLFKNVPMDQRFVISNPGPQWTDIIQQENRTFGDLIVLEHLHEDDFTANTIKTVEFYRWLANHSPRKYEFVSKMDADLYVNARAMWDRKIRPRLAPTPPSVSASGFRATVNHTVIGQLYYDPYHVTAFPQGAFYTVTWDLVELLPKLQDEFHVLAPEDLSTAWLLIKGRQNVNLAVLSEAEKFEFDPVDTRPGGRRTPWARNGTDVTSSWHALYGGEVIAVHQLKDEGDYLMVAGEFDEKGIKPMPAFPEEVPEGDEDGPKPGYPPPEWTKIPDDFWEVDVDGTLLCNGVWRMEPGVGRNMTTVKTTHRYYM